MPGMNSEQIEAAAAAWVVKRESGDWSSADQAQLETWIGASTAHRIAYIRLAAAWARSGRLSALGAGVPPGTIPARDSWGFSTASTAPAADVAGARNMPRARSYRRMSAAAALVAAITASGAICYFSSNRANSYSTAIGSVATVPLSDGSTVTLNTRTHIRVVLDSAARRITLDQGEAYFEVSKDAARPFVVEIADKRVIAVGTKFSIRRDGNDIRVLVTEGRVRIEHGGTAADQVDAQIIAGSEARTAHSALLIDQPTPTQVEQLLSWRAGYIVFRDTALADAVADFNRYSVRRIVIHDAEIADIRIGGNFRSNDTDAFLWLLQTGFPINVERRSDLIILTKR